MIPRAERSAIDCTDETKPSVMPAGYSLPDVTLPPPLAEMARDTILTGLCVRQMGMHSLLTAELENTETFRGTMVIGYYRGLPIFIEPMLTRSLLLRSARSTCPFPASPGWRGPIHGPSGRSTTLDGSSTSSCFLTLRRPRRRNGRESRRRPPCSGCRLHARVRRLQFPEITHPSSLVSRNKTGHYPAVVPADEYSTIADRAA